MWLLLLAALLAGVSGTLNNTTELPPPALLLPCDGLDTCQQGPQSPRAPRPLLSDTDWKERNCLCDQDCARFGDCCDDATTIKLMDTKNKAFECVDMRNFGGIYMVTKCPSKWRGDPETRRLCEETDNLADPLSSQMPVTDKMTATTYRNLHCALCNTDPDVVAELRDQWEMWGARLECPSVLTGSRDLASVRHALRFESGSWGLRLPRHISGTSPQPPPKNETADKFDKLDKLQALLQQTTNNETRSSRYRGRRVDIEKTTTEASTTSVPVISYRSRRIDNERTTNEAGTTSVPVISYRSRRIDNERTTNEAGATLNPVISFRSRRVDNERTTTEASTTSVPVVSTNSGLRHLSRRQYALYNASQFHRNDSALSTLLRQRRLHTTNVRLRRDTEPKDEVFHKCDVDPLLPDTLTHLVRRCRPEVIGECPSTWGDENVREMCESHTAHVFHSSSTYRNVYCAMCQGVQVQLLSCQPQIYTRFAFNKDFNLVAFAVLFDFGRGKGSVGSTSCPKQQLYDPFLGVCRNLVCDPDSTEVAGNGSCVARAVREPEPDISSNEINSTSLPPSCITYHLLQKEEYSILTEAKTLIIAASGTQLEEDKYQILENGSALVCNAAQLNYTLTYDSGDKFSAMLGYITIVGLGISIICLTLHLLAFCLISDRSGHGSGSSSGNSNSAKNLASLCSALLIAYLGFIAGQLVRDDRGFCVSSAIVTYYSFLAAFTWMFAVSLDIWRSLRMATTQLRTSYSGRKQWRKFFINSVCCWLIPACIVFASVVVENSPPGAVIEEIRPGFGARPGICWFSSRRALLVFFAAPVSVIMLLNAIFFTSSALMIYSTTASTAGGPRRDFRLYLRLAVLMGLTWSVGLLAGFLDTPLLWVVFVVLNTLQGLFIFLAFTCTDKMMRSMRSLWCCCCRRWRHRRRRELVTSSSLGAVLPDGVVGGTRKLGVPSSSDHLPWSAISSSFVSSKSSNSEESSRATDETLY